MHGVSVSDHGGDKAHWSGYWEERERKLKTHPVNAALFANLSSSLSGSALAVPAVSAAESNGDDAQLLSRIFEQCSIYFNGRVDSKDGLSSYSLGKLARLHGARVVLRAMKNSTTHVVCTQLSATKERQALGDAAGRSISLYFVSPTWITESISAGRRLSEVRFSLLARVAQEAGLRHLTVLRAPMDNARREDNPKESVPPPRELVQIEIAASQPEPTSCTLSAGEPVVTVPLVTVSDSQEGAPPTEIDSDEEEASDPGGDESPVPAVCTVPAASRSRSPRRS